MSRISAMLFAFLFCSRDTYKLYHRTKNLSSPGIMCFMQSSIVARMTKEIRSALADTSAEEKYRGMAIEAILSETEGNLAIDASGIKRLHVERGAGGDIEVSGGPDRLIIKSTAGKHVFTFGTKSISAKEAKAILKEAFGEVVK